MKNPETIPRRLIELLADRATGEILNHEEERELKDLLVAHPEVDEQSFELAAAAIHLALLASSVDPLPLGLRERLLKLAASIAAKRFQRVRQRQRLANPWLGWVAAASLLLFAQLQTRGESPSYQTIRDSKDTTVVAWAETGDPGGAGVTGEVFWSDELGTGFMTFHALPKNDPFTDQYQLWIFDPGHPAAYPVDGGVFDSSGTDLTVRIDAKLRVLEPSLFAVTLEHSGGVVVSSRERLLLAATVQR